MEDIYYGNWAQSRISEVIRITGIDLKASSHLHESKWASRSLRPVQRGFMERKPPQRDMLSTSLCKILPFSSGNHLNKTLFWSFWCFLIRTERFISLKFDIVFQMPPDFCSSVWSFVDQSVWRSKDNLRRMVFSFPTKRFKTHIFISALNWMNGFWSYIYNIFLFFFSISFFSKLQNLLEKNHVEFNFNLKLHAF